MLVEARGNLVRDLRSDGRSRVIALVGVEGLCVIETDDALLVLPREQAQDVRKVVERLQAPVEQAVWAFGSEKPQVAKTTLARATTAKV